MENKEKIEEMLTTAENPVKEEEESVTAGEIVETLHYLEEKADVLFAAQNPSVCTYAEGYIPRQTVFSCLTCTPEPQMAGICYGCSLNCHEGHNIIELYTKRKFRCDCGNSKFGSEKKCILFEQKDAENKYNVYGHNYYGKFCTCDVYYPEDESDAELFQCEICEDWYHEDHVPAKLVECEEQQTFENDDAAKDNCSMICTSCVTRLPFLMHIQPGKDIICHSKLSAEQLSGVGSPEPQALSIEKFRQKLCKCNDCVRVYEMADCEFLLDDEDDIATFEKESKKKAAENKTSDADNMRELVKEIGMDGAQKFYSEVNNFKRKLGEFVNSTGQDGKPISEDDVKKFFDNLKEERLQKRARLE